MIPKSNLALFSLALISALTTIQPAHAGSGDESIYQALKVAEVNATPPNSLGAALHEKSVGGLVCRKSLVVYPNAKPQYECLLSNQADAQAIWDALGIPEKNSTPQGMMGAATFKKTIGNLECEKSQGVYPGAKPSFQCSLKTRSTGMLYREAPGDDSESSATIAN